jgi:hypothetical protein
MANILSLQKTDGVSAPERENRNGVEQDLVRNRITYSDEGGTGTSEFVLRNTATNAKAVAVVVTTSALPASDIGNTLTAEFSYYDEAAREWTDYASSVTIDEIGPGILVRIRRRVVAQGSTIPRTTSAR